MVAPVVAQVHQEAMMLFFTYCFQANMLSFHSFYLNRYQRRMASKALEILDELIVVVQKASKQSLLEETKLFSAAGYSDQTFRKLVTKIDAQRTNESQIPMLGLGVGIFALIPFIIFSISWCHSFVDNIMTSDICWYDW